jgi:predicted metalloprotease
MFKKRTTKSSFIFTLAVLGYIGVRSVSFAAESSERMAFPQFVAQFHEATSLRQETIARAFGGKIMSGSGSVTEVARCGFLDESKLYRSSDCYKIVLDNGSPRAVLYFGSKDRDKFLQLNTGQRFSFENCTTISITNWGFWSTATCDLP